MARADFLTFFKMKTNLLNIGISGQGRVKNEIIEIFAQKFGVENLDSENKKIEIPDRNLRLIWIKGIETTAFRIEKYLLDGLIIGSDIAAEVDLILAKYLGDSGDDRRLESIFDFDRCRAKLAFLAPAQMNLAENLACEKPKIVLSKYPYLAKKLLDEQSRNLQNVHCRELESAADELAGQTRELAFDIVQSGRTAREAGLVEISGLSQKTPNGQKIKIPNSVPVSLQLFATRQASWKVSELVSW